MNLLYKNTLKSGLTTVIDEEVAELDYLKLDIARLKEGESFSQDSKDYELTLVIMGGRCTIETGSESWENLGSRLNVFDGKATAVYVPCQSSYQIKAESELEVAICGARAEEKTEPRLITPEEIVVHHNGKLTWERDVHDIVSLENTDAQRIIVGETFNQPGKWSSYPPHKHDVDNLPHEVNQEEVYHFRLNPDQGFGIQRVYTEDRSLDEIYVVENESSVVLPEGYHPVAAAPGYQLYYLWILAGDKRIMRPNDDPDHHWLKAVENMV